MATAQDHQFRARVPGGDLLRRKQLVLHLWRQAQRNHSLRSCTSRIEYVSRQMHHRRITAEFPSEIGGASMGAFEQDMLALPGTRALLNFLCTRYQPRKKQRVVSCFSGAGK